MKHFFFSLTVAVVMMSAGCTSFDYYGQKFDSASTEVVKVVWDKNEIDQDTYRMTGRGVLTVSATKDQFDIEEYLTDYAMEYGAEAVAVIDVIDSRKGIFSSEKINPQSADNTPVSDPVFGEEISLRGESHGKLIKDIHVLFFRNRKEVDSILQQRDAQLQKKNDGNWRGDK